MLHFLRNLRNAWRSCGVRKKLKGLLKPSVEFSPTTSCFPLDTFEKATEYYASVAIKRTGEQSFHVGILNRGPDGSECNLLHLASHAKLLSQDFQSGTLRNYYWIIPTAIPRLLQRPIALFCRKVYLRNGGKLPYGLFYDPATNFDIYGALLLAPQSAGLTCATFVLALFKRCGVNLLEIGKWEARPDDDALLQIMLDIAAKEDPAHVARLKAEPACARYRPAEVASACAFNPVPISFKVAQSSGATLESYLA